MADTTPTKSPFARLDTSLMRSTKSPEPQKPANQQAVKPAIQQVSNTAVQQTGKTAIPIEKTATEKVTYRFHPEGIEAIEEIKRILRRLYKIKTSYAEIAEEAIKLAYDDLLANQNDSKLARRLARKP